jgi:hypothetical protein
MPSRYRRSPQARRLEPLRSVSCEHLLESTTRYDQDQKLLTFLLVCPVCSSEKVVDTQRYEPRFQPHARPRLADVSAGAAVHDLPVRGDEQPMRRAA